MKKYLVQLGRTEESHKRWQDVNSPGIAMAEQGVHFWENHKESPSEGDQGVELHEYMGKWRKALLKNTRISGQLWSNPPQVKYHGNHS